jgi:mannose-1-phosphate guanylyltransferase
MVIVDSGDALLICPKDRAEEVRHVVEWLKQTGREGYLVDAVKAEG